MVDNEKKKVVLTELQARLAYRNMQFIEQNNSIEKLNKALHLLKSSSSWRLTRPLRFLARMINGR